MDAFSLAFWFSVFVHENEIFLGGILLFAGLFLFPRRLVFLYASVVSALVGFALKFFFHLPRPCVDAAALVACPPDFGFPSLHALLSAVLLMGSLGSRWALLAFPLALAISLSRVFLGVHSMAQVIAGFSLGVVVYMMAWLRWRDAP
ncbi:MAG: phosphatase PAP2 family protein [Candidatus Micrarchaeota archaeon]|nr:phosphatase PAP2 family protein [Candidatus Micrarchaeota archaeon]